VVKDNTFHWRSVVVLDHFPECRLPDVDEEGRENCPARLHRLVCEPGSIMDRTFEIAFLDAGVEAYVFTFG